MRDPGSFNKLDSKDYQKVVYGFGHPHALQTLHERSELAAGLPFCSEDIQRTVYISLYRDIVRFKRICCANVHADDRCVDDATMLHGSICTSKESGTRSAEVYGMITLGLF